MLSKNYLKRCKYYQISGLKNDRVFSGRVIKKHLFLIKYLSPNMIIHHIFGRSKLFRKRKCTHTYTPTVVIYLHSWQNASNSGQNKCGFNQRKMKNKGLNIKQR